MPLDKEGREILDSTPMSIPLGFQRPETIQETMRRLIRDEDIQRELRARGLETFEESEDFDIDEDSDPMPDTPWETDFDPMLGKEIYKSEKRLLDQAREEFHEKVHKEKKKKWFNWSRNSERRRTDEPAPRESEGPPRRQSTNDHGDRSDRSFTQEAPRQRREED